MNEKFPENHNSRELADLSSFEVSRIDLPKGEMDIPRFDLFGYNISDNSYFNVTYEYGFIRQAGPNQGQIEYEPDTLYIDLVEATEGKGLGSAALKLALESAKKDGYQVGRMGLINPRMVGLVDNLKQHGVINEYYLKIEDGPQLRAMLPTDKLADYTDCVDADTALDYLKTVDARVKQAVLYHEDEEAQMGSIDCVFKF